MNSSKSCNEAPILKITSSISLAENGKIAEGIPTDKPANNKKIIEVIKINEPFLVSGEKIKQGEHAKTPVKFKNVLSSCFICRSGNDFTAYNSTDEIFNISEVKNIIDKNVTIVILCKKCKKICDVIIKSKKELNHQIKLVNRNKIIHQ